MFTDDFQKLFKRILHSDPGTNARAKEEQTYMFFIDFLEECEIGEMSVMCLMIFISLFIFKGVEDEDASVNSK